MQYKCKSDSMCFAWLDRFGCSVHEDDQGTHMSYSGTNI